MSLTLNNLKQIPGAGRGKKMTVPTINFPVSRELQAIPFGVYAGVTSIEEKSFPSAIHYGPIPTFLDTEARLEVYFIDETDVIFPSETLFDVKILERIRDIKQFENSETLKEQILTDIAKIWEILTKR